MRLESVPETVYVAAARVPVAVIAPVAETLRAGFEVTTT